MILFCKLQMMESKAKKIIFDTDFIYSWNTYQENRLIKI